MYFFCSDTIIFSGKKDFPFMSRESAPTKIILSFELGLSLKYDVRLDLSSLEEVVSKLANQEKLDEKYHDHPLSGNYSDFRECHIKPDWLFVYATRDEELELFLFRTGSHSPFF